MKESARAAQSFVWSHAEALGIDPQLFRQSGVHIHVPAGAVPKDGPSAGVAMVTALTSLYTGVPVRADIAMTGEITLSGLVLPVGGIKEKVLAARRAGIRQVVLPRDNEADLRELPADVREEMQLHPGGAHRGRAAGDAAGGGPAAARRRRRLRGSIEARWPRNGNRCRSGAVSCVRRDLYDTTWEPEGSRARRPIRRIDLARGLR